MEGEVTAEMHVPELIWMRRLKLLGVASGSWPPTGGFPQTTTELQPTTGQLPDVALILVSV